MKNLICYDCGFDLQYYNESDDTLCGCDICKQIIENINKDENLLFIYPV